MYSRSSSGQHSHIFQSILLKTSGIDIIKIKAGKNEQAYVCDKGNSCTRLITNVHSFHAEQFIGTVKIHGIPLSWKLEALTVIPNSHTIAISESTKIFLLSLDNSLTSGELHQVIDSLNAPCGLCVSPITPNSLLVGPVLMVLHLKRCYLSPLVCVLTWTQQLFPALAADQIDALNFILVSHLLVR